VDFGWWLVLEAWAAAGRPVTKFVDGTGGFAQRRSGADFARDGEACSARKLNLPEFA
jgi:hypothetical protein